MLLFGDGRGEIVPDYRLKETEGEVTTRYARQYMIYMYMLGYYMVVVGGEIVPCYLLKETEGEASTQIC